MFKEETKILNGIKPWILEQKIANEKLDTFIRNEIARGIIPLRLENRIRTAGNQDQKRVFASPTGLIAFVFNGDGHAGTLTVNRERMVFGDHTDVHFTPHGRNSFHSSKITESLAEGIRGIVDLLSAIDQGRFEATPVFVGITNINMALIAQRLGFAIVDQDRNPNGSINRNLRFFTVVGKLEDIRARVAEFQKAGVDQKLANRSQRLQARQKLAPVGS